MTARARLYITIASSRHLLVGLVCILFSGWFGEPYSSIKDLLPLWAWGILFLGGATHLGYAAVTGREGPARVALIFSAAFSAAWATGFLLGGNLSDHAIELTLWWALVAKDLVICRQPLRSPFEELARTYHDGG